jgi:regulator of sirC expression with transglutaminase-like and TPR domain
MEELSNEIFQHCLEFLTNDGVAVGRLSLCSTCLYDKVNGNSKLWKMIYHSRWTSGIPKGDLMEFYRIEYPRRHNLDKHVTEILFCMAEDLQLFFQLEENGNNHVDGDPHIGQAWDHLSWKKLLTFRDEITDILRLHALRNQPSSCTVYQRLLGFLACRCLQNIQLGECLLDWKELAFHESRQMGDYNLILMERYSILICQIQQTPEEQLNAPKAHTAKSVTSQLDKIADECRRRIQQLNSKMDVANKLLLVKDILVKEYKFSGNTENYYDYHNSLLGHVLQTRKGIPITLCIIFACVCRRLKLHTFLVGLPGHVVLGFQDNTRTDEDGFYVEGETMYLDVFRTGQVLTVSDCQRICNSYGIAWNEEYLRPLTASQILNRTFNNLSNCHLQSMAAGDDTTTLSPYRTDLYFQQRALASIHRQPKSIAGPLVERITKEFPLTLSPELLRHYGFLSTSVESTLEREATI